MRYLTSVMLVIVGLIHVLPLSGLLGAERLSALYGLNFSDPNLGILMRHRAVLFGLLGAFLIFAAFKPEYQKLALIAGSVSVVSFLWLALSASSYNSLIGRVVVADWIALGCLALALIGRLR